MRTRMVGFQDLIELERCASNTIENIFFEFDKGRENANAVQNLVFHAYPSGAKDEFNVEGMGISKSNETLIRVMTTLELPEGMTKREAATFLAFRIIQVMAPSGWMEADQGSFHNDASEIATKPGFLRLMRR